MAMSSQFKQSVCWYGMEVYICINKSNGCNLLLEPLNYDDRV